MSRHSFLFPFRLLAGTFLVALAFFAAAFLVMAAPARADADAVYTLENVQVDITASDAATARDMAFTQAQQAAFRQLSLQLVGADNAARLRLPDDTTLATMVKDYETTAEQISSVRYLGTYTVRFRGPAVRGYLLRQGMTPGAAPAVMSGVAPGTGMASDTASPATAGAAPAEAPGKILVLPFYQQDSNVSLWNDDNPWLAAWEKSTPAAGGTQVLAPLADASDMADIDGGSISYDRAALTRMAQRYGTGDVALLVAAPSDRGTPPGAVTVTIYRTDRDDPQPTGKVTTAPRPGESDDAFYARLVGQLRAALQHDWKHGSPASAAAAAAAAGDKPFSSARHGDAFTGLPANDAVAGDMVQSGGASAGGAAPSAGRYHAHASFHGLSEWIRLQRALRSTDGVSDMHVGALSPAGADVDFSYRGTPGALRISLIEAGVAVSPGTAGDYILRLSSAAN